MTQTLAQQEYTQPDELFFKRVAALLYQTGGRLVIVEGKDYKYRFSYKGNTARLNSLDSLLDWFRTTGFQEVLIGRQLWELQEGYDSPVNDYPIIDAEDLSPSMLVRIPFSKGDPWRILKIVQQSEVMIFFTYEEEGRSRTSEPQQACYSCLFPFQHLKTGDESAAEMLTF